MRIAPGMQDLQADLPTFAMHGIDDPREVRHLVFAVEHRRVGETQKCAYGSALGLLYSQQSVTR